MLTAKQLNHTIPYALDEELDWITGHVQGLKNIPEVVMLGAGPGVFALAAIEGNPDLTLYIIDHDTTRWAYLHLRGAEYDRGIYIEDDSAYVGKGWLQSVNLLIVDADHSYEGVKRDIQAWWDKVVVEGYVFFHDYLERPGGFDGLSTWKPSGVAKAIEELKGDSWELVAQPGISAVYRKKK